MRKYHNIYGFINCGDYVFLKKKGPAVRILSGWQGDYRPADFLADYGRKPFVS
jgi:hypothetical protein